MKIDLKFQIKKTLISSLLLLVSVIIGILIVNYGIKIAGFSLVFILGIPVVYGVVRYPEFGISILIILAYFILWFIRMGIIDFPLGTLMDGMEALLILGFFIKQKQQPDWTFLKNPISIMIIVWVIYNILEIGNPSASSRMAWLYTIRSLAAVTLLFFVFCYHIKTISYLSFLIKLWLSLSLFAALYALKQEYIGFFQFEMDSIDSPLQRSLLFINGSWRKFSIFSDPVAFSYNMVISSIISIVLIFGKRPIWAKMILGIMTILFLFVMLLSGTRGAYVLLPAALAFFVILNLNKRVFIISIFAGLCFLFFIKIPTSNPSIKRFQSAFAPSNDASFNVRKANQKMIQPYILTHPLGGGLGATGVWGARFSPGSFLSSFPPDSGYVRTAVELGPIGLLIFCTLMFTILKTGIDNFFTIKDPILKNYTLAMVLVLFALGIGNYPQEAFVQFPNNILFYLAIAMIVVLKKLDSKSSSLIPSSS